MSKETDRQARERGLVKMTPDEFADRFNAGFRRAYQQSWNREVVLLILIAVAIIGFGLYRSFFAG